MQEQSTRVTMCSFIKRNDDIAIFSNLSQTKMPRISGSPPSLCPVPNEKKREVSMHEHTANEQP